MGNWVKGALDARSWKLITIKVAGQEGPAWIRKLGPTEQTKLYRGVFTAPSAPEPDPDTGETPAADPDTVDAALEAGKKIVQWCFAPDDNGVRVEDQQLLSEADVELLDIDEVLDLAELVTEHSGMTKEAAELARGFRSKPE